MVWLAEARCKGLSAGSTRLLGGPVAGIGLHAPLPARSVPSGAQADAQIPLIDEVKAKRHDRPPQTCASFIYERASATASTKTAARPPTSSTLKMARKRRSSFLKQKRGSMSGARPSGDQPLRRHRREKPITWTPNRTPRRGGA